MNRFLNNSFPTWIALFVFCAIIDPLGIVCANPCEASHPFHVSSAEVNWNAKSGNFEVALYVWPADLEKAIARQQMKSIDLDKVERLDELMKEYVTSRFSIRFTSEAKSDPLRKAEAGEDSIDIRWVGHEMDLQKAWLYFEIPGDQHPGQWKIENRVFFELNEDQVNHIKLTAGGRPDSFSLGKSKAKMSFSTEKSEAKRIRQD